MRPIVAVIGTTGVGKSQLAVHLAQCLEGSPTSTEVVSSGPRYSRGKVLSADSMQLYKGLDVITNKVTPAEMSGVDHWGLNIVEPGRESSWELGTWVNQADKEIDSLPETTLPIVCGGTHYFIQHFLFPPVELCTSRPSASTIDTAGTPAVKASASRWTPPHPHPPVPDLDSELARLLDTFWTSDPIWPGEIRGVGSSSQTAYAATATNGAATWTDSQLLSLHTLLQAVDPREAGRWHWRDGRKVKRGLERWWERGNDIEDAPKEVKGESRKARFRTLIFWVYEPMETLRPRLDRRVDKMVENGLLREIAELRGIAKEVYGTPEAADRTEGIFQAIGYKEFASLPIQLDSCSDPAAHPSFPAMLDRMKISTHQYAKSQLKWISNQLLPAVREARASGGEVAIYVVPGGAANEEIARQILSGFLAETSLPDPVTVGHPQSEALLAPLQVGLSNGNISSIASRQATNLRRTCDLCSSPSAPYSVMSKDWDLHVKSKLHRRNTVAADGGREALIEKQKAQGLARAAERARLKELNVATQVDPP